MLREHITFSTEHGSPYDRGAADSYYGRARDPHYWPFGTYKGARVSACNMTEDEIAAYNAGYDDNEAEGNHKDWG